MSKTIVREAGPTPSQSAPPELTPQQVQEVLSHIVSIADAARALASRLGEGLKDTDEARQLYCVAYLFDQIGALADYALGDKPCIGDFGRWMIGPVFDKGRPSHPQGRRTPGQIDQILCKISVTASAAWMVASRVAEDLDGHDAAMEAYAIAYLIEQIGGLADFTPGGKSAEGFARFLGPNFQAGHP